MGVMDWVDASAVAKGESLDWWSGSFSLTLGDELCGYLGSRSAHILGPDYTIVCDLEDLLGQIPGIGPAIEKIATIASGLGGSTLFDFGGSNSFIYGGPVASIRRGPAWNKSSNSLFGKKSDFQGPGSQDVEEKPVDVAVEVLVGVLSALLILTLVGMYIGAKINQSKLATIKKDTSKTKEEKEQESKEPEHHMEQFTLVIKIVAPRLLALIRMLEEACAIGEFGKEFVKIFWPVTAALCLASAVAIVALTLAATVTAIPAGIAIMVAVWLEKDDEMIKGIVDSVTGCVKKAVELVKDAAEE